MQICNKFTPECFLRNQLCELPDYLVPPAYPLVADHIVSLRRSVRNADWPTVYHHASHASGLGKEYWRQLLGFLEQETYNTLFLNEARSIFNEAFVNLPEDVTLDQVRSLTQDLPDPLRSDLLARLDETQDLDGGQPLISEPIENGFEDYHEVLICAMMRGMQGKFHYFFNQVHGEFAAPDDINVTRQIVETFSVVMEEYGSQLRELQQLLYEALKTNSGEEEVLAVTQKIVDWIENSLPSLGAASARALRCSDGLRANGLNIESEAAGKILISAGHFVREALCSYCSALAIHTEIVSKSVAGDDPVYEVDDSLDFDTVAPNGLNVEIHRLDESHEGEFVEISGLAVRFHQNRRPSGFLISEVDLLDPSSNQTITCYANIFNLTNLGVTENAYVNLSGIYRSEQSSLDGRPGIQIDVHSLSELEDRSWRYRFLEKGSKWIELWRGKLNLRWAIGPHSQAADDSNSPNRGAAELIFPPFVRR